MGRITLAQEKLYTAEGRGEMRRKVDILRRHKYSDEEIATDLNITVTDVKLLMEWSEFEECLV